MNTLFLFFIFRSWNYQKIQQSHNRMQEKFTKSVNFVNLRDWDARKQLLIVCIKIALVSIQYCLKKSLCRKGCVFNKMFIETSINYYVNRYSFPTQCQNFNFSYQKLKVFLQIINLHSFIYLFSVFSHLRLPLQHYTPPAAMY